jgi:hypothetical protein
MSPAKLVEASVVTEHARRRSRGVARRDRDSGEIDDEQPLLRRSALSGCSRARAGLRESDTERPGTPSASSDSRGENEEPDAPCRLMTDRTSLLSSAMPTNSLLDDRSPLSHGHISLEGCLQPFGHPGARRAMNELDREDCGACKRIDRPDPAASDHDQCFDARWRRERGVSSGETTQLITRCAVRDLSATGEPRWRLATTSSSSQDSSCDSASAERCRRFREAKKEYLSSEQIALRCAAGWAAADAARGRLSRAAGAAGGACMS